MSKKSSRPNIAPVTAAEKRLWPKKPIVRLEKPFIDVRGLIQPLVDLDMKSAVLIESTKGSLRANHYHLTDWHYCYVLEGRMEYFHRPHGKSGKPELLVVEEGHMVFTPPMTVGSCSNFAVTSRITCSLIGSVSASTVVSPQITREKIAAGIVQPNPRSNDRVRSPIPV